MQNTVSVIGRLQFRQTAQITNGMCTVNKSTGIISVGERADGLRAAEFRLLNKQGVLAHPKGVLPH